VNEQPKHRWCTRCSLPLHDVNTQQQNKLMVGSSDMLSICTVAQQFHHEVSDKKYQQVSRPSQRIQAVQ